LGILCRFWHIWSSQ